MQFRGVLLALTLSLLAAPAFAVHSGQDATASSTQSVGAQKAWGKPNINAGSNQSITNESAFPQGKNAVKIVPEKVISTPTRPKKTICVGADCGCTSAKSH